MSNFSIFRSSKHFPKQYMPKHNIIILQTIGGNGNIQKRIFPTIHTAIILRITLTEIIVIAKLPVVDYDKVIICPSFKFQSFGVNTPNPEAGKKVISPK